MNTLPGEEAHLERLEHFQLEPLQTLYTRVIHHHITLLDICLLRELHPNQSTAIRSILQLFMFFN